MLTLFNISTLKEWICSVLSGLLKEDEISRIVKSAEITKQQQDKTRSES